ncbi:hypothetical protein LR48_Vigan09g090600 [Vigna angularis]|uniref:UvrD-like helicase ATP-binding domain-containing protein n=1 Tax=Phaseolus angularis TaxID=3914 RepID=A0A0L9VBE2_PHAAN|nr:hypothetical protein LR48_Vigan09g090600 [Vigna angularis]
MDTVAVMVVTDMAMATVINEEKIPAAVVMRFLELEKFAFFWWLLQFLGYRDANGNDTTEADKTRAEHEECTLLMKYCSISRDYMLHGQDSLQADLPYEVTDEQRNIIRFSKSIFVLGRSGTGKTTVLITMLIQNEILHRKGVQQWYGSGINANQEQSKDIATETERPVLIQLFVTLSAGLCQKVQHHVSLLKRSLGEVGPVAESTAKQFENIPDSFDGGTGTIEHGKLSREEYCDVSENRTSGLSTETRIMIYDIFQNYETMKMKNGDFDLCDLVIYLHSRLRDER